MPLKQGSGKKAMSSNYKELKAGKQYKATKAKYGKAVADKQVIAIMLGQAGKSNQPKTNKPKGK